MKKGIGIISLVLAFIALFPGFWLIWVFVHEEYTEINPDYMAWQKEYDQRKRDLIGQQEEEIIDKELAQEGKKDGEAFNDPTENDEILNEMLKNKPALYNYPPIWQKIAGGIVGASLSFLIVLFSIRGTTRLFVRASKGFKNLE